MKNEVTDHKNSIDVDDIKEPDVWICYLDLDTIITGSLSFLYEIPKIISKDKVRRNYSTIPPDYNQPVAYNNYNERFDTDINNQPMINECIISVDTASNMSNSTDKSCGTDKDENADASENAEKGDIHGRTSCNANQLRVFYTLGASHFSTEGL